MAELRMQEDKIVVVKNFAMEFYLHTYAGDFWISENQKPPT